MRIGIIGTGNIASYVLKVLNEECKLQGEVVSIFGRNKEAGELLATQYSITFFMEFQEFIQSSIDIVIEAATIEAAAEYMEAVLESKKSMIVSSIGALKDYEFMNRMKKNAEINSSYIYLPSGAIGGLDLLQSANALGGLSEVRIITRKSPASLGLPTTTAEKLLFDGFAIDAIEKFPKNVNVALLLSLAGIGAEKTKVQIIADPAIAKNTHTIEAIGDFGTMHLKIENEPMPDNPKTSYLAALSILAVLQNKDKAIVIGK